jgi:hypothetical protein
MMRNFAAVGIMLGSLVPLAGAASELKSPQVGTVAIGARTDVAEAKRVGAIERPIADPTPVPPGDLLGMVEVTTTSVGTCTGMVIASDTVLTAAHCVCTESWVGGNVCQTRAEVRFRDDPSTPGSSRPRLSGAVTFHPAYNPSWTEAQMEHDVAIIKLDGVSPAYVKPVILAADYLAQGSTVMIAGRGRTGNDCGGDPGTFNFDLVPFDGYEDGHDIMRFDDTVFCLGDSGGPVLDEAGKRVFAVQSMKSWSGATKAVTTGSEFEWIKSFMCKSSRWNRCDGNGDVCGCSARTNILWRNADGQVAIWFMDGGNNAAQAYPRLVHAARQTQGTGDFNADGHADILWRHANGQTAVWFMVDGVIAGEAYPGGQDSSLFWKVQGVGDFDDDGHSDILWRDGNGQLAIWFKGDMAGAAFPGYDNQPAPVHTSWQVQGVGDFNGDARSDILWRNTNGQVAIWFMNGATRIDESVPGGQDPSLFWKIQAVGDFDGNLRSDILWRDADGRLAIWFDGRLGFDAPSYKNVPGPGDLSWMVQAIGDFDHDRRDDILWRHTNGQVGIWLMNGAHFVGDAYPGSPDSGWQIKGLLKDSGL